MPSKKRVHLQQFGIIHLPNTDLTYIRNPERNKNSFMSFHLLETYIRNPSLFFISFFTVGEFRKTRHPRNVEFDEVLEVCFSVAGNSRFSGAWILRSFRFANLRISGIVIRRRRGVANMRKPGTSSWRWCELRRAADSGI
jgi:hypothetical protein